MVSHMMSSHRLIHMMQSGVLVVPSTNNLMMEMMMAPNNMMTTNNLMMTPNQLVSLMMTVMTGQTEPMPGPAVVDNRLTAVSHNRGGVVIGDHGVTVPVSGGLRGLSNSLSASTPAHHVG